MIEILVQLLGPLHPPLTHFPIVCSLLALLALGFSSWTRKAWLQEATAWLWILTFLSALAGGLSGHLFALHLGLEKSFSIVPPETILSGLLREHVLWAMGSLFLSAVSFAAALKILKGKAWSKRAHMALGLGVAVGFGLTGHEGGEMIYGGQETSLPPAISATMDPNKSAVTPKTKARGEKPQAAPDVSSRTSDPLERAKNYREKLVKVNAQMWNSRTHGHRWVNTYVSKESVEAYNNGDSLPEGALVVKDSFENKGGNPSETRGPLYVMWKGKISDSPSAGGWQYALVWEKPVPGNPEGITEPVQWRPGDSHLNSCIKCHNHFKTGDYMGGVP